MDKSNPQTKEKVKGSGRNELAVFLNYSLKNQNSENSNSLKNKSTNMGLTHLSRAGALCLGSSREMGFEVHHKLFMHFSNSSSDYVTKQWQSSSQTRLNKTFSIIQNITNYDAFHFNLVGFSSIWGIFWWHQRCCSLNSLTIYQAKYTSVHEHSKVDYSVCAWQLEPCQRWIAKSHQLPSGKTLYKQPLPLAI